MKLYELNEYWNNIVELMEQVETEEEKEKLQNALNNIDEAIEEKADNIAKLVTELNANAQVLKNEEQRLSTKRKAIENNVKSLKNYLESTMITQSKKKFKTNLFSFNIQKNIPSLDITEESNIPKDFYIEQQPKLDKKSLLQAVKNGLEIDGVSIKQSESLRIR